MVTKTLPDNPRKFTSVGKDAATGETTNNAGLLLMSQEKTTKSQTKAEVSSP